MQFLLKGTKDIELEKECIKFAKETKALHYFEKPPGNLLYIKLICLNFIILFGLTYSLKNTLVVFNNNGPWFIKIMPNEIIF